MRKSNVASGTNHLKRVRLVCSLLLTSALLSVSVFSFERKKTWQETLKANPVEKEMVMNGWAVIGPFQRETVLWNNPHPPEKKIDPKAGCVYRAKSLKWKKQPSRDGRLVVYKGGRDDEYFAYADFPWSQPERVVFRIHTKGARYITVNGKKVWEWDYISDQRGYAFTVALNPENRIFMKISGFRSFIRILYCSGRVARERTELLLYLCEQFGEEHERIFHTAKEVLHYLDAYGMALSPEYRRKARGRLKTVLEQSLEKEISAQRLSWYLDFCGNSQEQPLAPERLETLISRCPEKNKSGLLFKLAKQYITAFGLSARGWDMLKDLTRRPEKGDSLTDDLYRFCVGHGHYLECAEIFLSIAETGKAENQLGIMWKLSELYRQLGDTGKAIAFYENVIKNAKKTGRDDKQTAGMIKRAGAYIISLSRQMNKENVCVLPRAVGMSNRMDYIGNLAAGGQMKKAYTELLNVIEKQGFRVVNTGSDVTSGTMTYLQNHMRKWPEKFREYIHANIKKRAAAVIQRTGGADQRALRNLWNESGMATGTALLFIPCVAQLLTKGDVRSAVSWYQEMIKRCPVPSVYLSYAYALYLSGNDERAEDLRRQLKKNMLNATVQFRGEETTLSKGLAMLSKAFAKKQQPVDVGIPSVNAWTDRVSPADRILCRAEDAYPGDVQPPCVPARKDDSLYIYTGSVLRAYDMRSGRLRWSVRVRSGKRMLRETPVPVFRILVCRGRVYVRVPGSGYSLNAYSCASGEEVWSSQHDPELKGLHVASDPVLIGGVVVFCAARYHKWERLVTGADLFAAAVHPDTDDVMWKRLLVSGDSMYGNEDVSRHLPRAVETGRGIFIQTNRKVLQMLDPLSGAIKWTLGYDRSVAQNNRYTLHLNTAAVYKDYVAVAPRDSSSVYCVDISRGQIRWAVSRGQSPVVCGTYQGNAVLLGRDLRLLDMGTGKEVNCTRISSGNRFPLPFVSGKRLWISSPSSTTLFDLETMKEMSTDLPLEHMRVYPASGCAVAEAVDHISVYGYSRDDFTSSGGQERRFVHAGKNCMGLKSVLEGKRKIAQGGKAATGVSAAVRPVLWWMKPMDMEGFGRVRGGTELFVWNRSCVRLIETEFFGETLWEHSFNPRTFHVNHVQNIGDRVLVCGSRKISCLDISSGREKWRITMPMYVRSLQWNNGKAYLYSQRVLAKDHVWRADILDTENGEISRFASGGDRQAAPFIWANHKAMFFHGYKIFWAVDISKRKTIWKKKMDHSGFRYARLFEPGPDSRSILYMKRAEDTILKEPDTGKDLLRIKDWEFLPGIWQAYNEPYAHYKNRIKRFAWNNKKKTLEKKWETEINDFQDRWVTSYHIVGNNLVIFSHAGDSYIELTQLDRSTGTIKRRDRLVRVSGGYRSLHSPIWSGNRLYALSDRMLYSVCFPGSKDALKKRNKQRISMLSNPCNKLDRTRSIRMYQSSSRGVRPRWDLAEKKMLLDTEKQWFPSDGRDTSYWKGSSDVALSVSGKIHRNVLHIQIDVTDDAWVPFTDQYTGDRLIVTTGKNTAYAGMDTTLEPVVRGISNRYIGDVTCRILDNNTIRYTIELNLHAHYFMKYHAIHKNRVSRLSVGVSYADDDGKGVEGVLAWPQPHEWGVIQFEWR